MPVYKLTIEYMGTDYSGWQVQRNATTVQGELLRAMEIIFRRPVQLQGASRTDAGVHSLGQVASFYVNETIEPVKVARSLCALAGPKIAVINVEQVDEQFNARFCARGKHYVYKVLNRSAPSPLLAATSWHVTAQLEIEHMKQSARQLIGTHDFAGFRAIDCGRENTVRTITDSDILVKGDLIEIHIKGTAFLKYMVRIIAGTLVDISRGVLPLDTIECLFESKDRNNAGRTAPACGLTLVEVFYPKV